MHALGSHLIPISCPGSDKQTMILAQPNCSHVATRGPVFSNWGQSHTTKLQLRQASQPFLTTPFARPIVTSMCSIALLAFAKKEASDCTQHGASKHQVSSPWSHSALSLLIWGLPEILQKPPSCDFFSKFSALPNSGQAEHLTRSSFPAVSLLVSGTAGSPVMGTTGLRVLLCPGSPPWCHMLNMHLGGSSFSSHRFAHGPASYCHIPVQKGMLI